MTKVTVSFISRSQYPQFFPQTKINLKIREKKMNKFSLEYTDSPKQNIFMSAEEIYGHFGCRRNIWTFPLKSTDTEMVSIPRAGRIKMSERKENADLLETLCSYVCLRKISTIWNAVMVIR